MIKKVHGVAGLALSGLSLIAYQNDTTNFILQVDRAHKHIVASCLPLIGGYSDGKSCHYSIDLLDKSSVRSSLLNLAICAHKSASAFNLQ